MPDAVQVDSCPGPARVATDRIRARHATGGWATGGDNFELVQFDSLDQSAHRLRRGAGGGRRLAGALVSALFALSLTAHPAQAAPGDLDRGFGGDGTVTTDFSGAPEQARGIQIQADGKLVVAGNTSFYRGGNNTEDVAITRYNADGSPDTSFGGDGKETTDLGGPDSAAAVALQSDGKIVVVGSNGSDFALARYNRDGSLDTSFGGDGLETTDFGAFDAAQAVALQPDGRIVVVGSTSPFEGDPNFALARYNRDGSLDRSFSGDGMETTDFGSRDAGNAVAIQADGKIVAAGDGTGSGDDFALARYRPNGSLDPSFSDDGKQTTHFGGDAGGANALAIQPDGKIVAAGEGTFDFDIARYRPDGSLDPSFSDDGKQTTDFGAFDTAQAIALQPDGKVVVAGSNPVFSPTRSSDFALARYLPDGNLDPTFSGDGRQTIDFRPFDSASALALQPDGKVVAVGSSEIAFQSEMDFAVARLQGGPPETTIASGPLGRTNDNTPTFEFSSNLAASTFLCRIDGGPLAPCSSPHTTAPLTEGPHLFEVRAIDSSGTADPTPAARSITVAATGGGLPLPVLGKTFNVEPLGGQVFVSLRGRPAAASRFVRGLKGRRFVPLRAARQLPVGSFLDTRNGIVRLTTATDRKSARLRSGIFSSGVFQVLQSRARRAKGLTELRLKGSSFRRCRTLRHARGAFAARHRRRSIRRLRGNAKGRFSTRGRFSAATVRGTVWTVMDRCDGTLTKVGRGRVAVRDFRRRKTVLVGAGKSYLARGRR